MGSLPSGLRFDLAGEGVQAECLTDRRGDIALNLELEGARYAFGTHRYQGVGVDRVGIGTLLTVRLKQYSDLDRFSLLLPDVELPGFGDAEVLRTMAIRTQIPPDNLDVHNPPIPTMLVQSYRVFQLDGTVKTRDPASMYCPIGWSAATAKNDRELTVNVVCTFPRAGYVIDLRPAQSQDGGDPNNLWLQLSVRKPTGQTATTPTQVRTSYTEDLDRFYQRVTILPDGPGFSIQREEQPFPLTGEQSQPETLQDR
jgi:hypothetical protein